jgi:hypothetical protein
MRVANFAKEILMDQSGMHHKYDVTRTDGQSAPGEKHHGCRYLVLDLDHDPDGRAAAAHYAERCALQGIRLQFGLDLLALLKEIDGR